MPRVLNFGIAVGMASSIPQFNLVEVCDKLEVLLDNPNATFDELYCPPDFATGALIMNESEVKESLKKGTGKTIINRAVMEYDEAENCFVVTEIPYGTTGRGIVKDITKGVDNKTIVGVKSVQDGTDIKSGPLGVTLYIYLEDNAHVPEVARQLYRNTKLQNSFSVNMRMLKDGKHPQVFGWKEMMVEYLKHLQNVVKRSLEFDKRGVEEKINLLEGYVTAIDNIDQVIELIRSSETDEEAVSRLQKRFLLNEIQAKAITNMRLRRLIGMNAVETQNELDTELEKLKALTFQIENEDAFKENIKQIIHSIRKEYGDKRRTKVMDLKTNLNEEIIEEATVTAYFTDRGNVVTKEATSLVAKKRGAKGKKVELNEGEYVVGTITASNLSTVTVFTNLGKAYNVEAKHFPVDATINLNEFIKLDLAQGEKIVSIQAREGADEDYVFTMVTKNSKIKRTGAEEYTSNRKTGVVAINLDDGDELVEVLLTPAGDEGELLMYTKNCLAVRCPVSQVRVQGRNTKGVNGPTLGDGDTLAGVVYLDGSYDKLFIVTDAGLGKVTDLEEITLGSNRTNKGLLIANRQKDTIKTILPLKPDTVEIRVIAGDREVALQVDTIGELSRTASGNIISKEDIRAILYN